MLGARHALAVLLVATCAVARAQGFDPGHGGEALPDLAATPVLQAREPGRVAVGGGLRYGYTEDVLESDDAHHRAGLLLSGSYAPMPWAALAASFDFRYDTHVGGPNDGDGGAVGQTRLHARADHEVVRGTRLGAGFALRLPPAVDVGAAFASLGAELQGIATHALGLRALVSGALGFRLDRSNGAVDDISRLTASDRVALGASDSHALLLAVAGAYDAGPVVALLSLGWDVLVGDDAPGALKSPMRLSLGARHELRRALWLEGLATFSLSQRPDPSESALVPIEPRVLLAANVGYTFDPRPPPAPPKPLPPPAPAAPSQPRGALLGEVVDATGAPVAGANMLIASLGIDVTSDAEGRFALDDLPAGMLELYVQAPQWQPVALRLEVAPGPAELRIVLTERLPLGQIRGTVRGTGAVPIAAQISVTPLNVTLRAADDGTFVLDVAPGPYQVTITAPGYEMQQRQVDVEHNGVTVLLVDLRSAE